MSYTHYPSSKAVQSLLLRVSKVGSHFLYVSKVQKEKPHPQSLKCIKQLKVMCNKSESLHLFEDVEKDLTERFTWWEVDDKGNIKFKGHTKTSISAEDLVIGNLLTHVLSRKRNENEESANSEFYFAFMLALKRAGYKKITIDIENLHNPIITER